MIVERMQKRTCKSTDEKLDAVPVEEMRVEDAAVVDDVVEGENGLWRKSKAKHHF